MWRRSRLQSEATIKNQTSGRQTEQVEHDAGSFFRIKDTLLASFSFSTLPFRPSLSSRRDQKKLFCTGAPPSVLPSRKPARTLTRTDFPATFLPATLTTGHASGGLGARPSAARLPPPSSPPSQHMQSLPWVRWQGHWPGPRPRDRGEGAHMWPRRREGEGQPGDAEIEDQEARPHPHQRLPSSSHQPRMEVDGGGRRRGGNEKWRPGWRLSLRHLPPFILSFTSPLFSAASGHSPPLTTFILPSASLCPRLAPSSPLCVRETRRFVLFQR